MPPKQSTTIMVKKDDEEHFFLPGDYYRRVHPLIGFAMVTSLWVVLPIMAFFPNAFDFLWTDRIGDFIERNHFNLIKAFNFFLWVSISHINLCRY